MQRARTLAVFAAVAVLSSVGACDESGTVVHVVVPCSAAPVAPMDRFSPQEVAVYVEAGADPGLALVQHDVGTYLAGLWGLPAVAVTDGAPDFSSRLTLWFSTSKAARSRLTTPPADGYAIQRTDSPTGTLVLVYAPDTTNLAFGAYAFLEELGVRFFHPKEEYVPALGAVEVPRSLSVTRSSPFQSRGIQLHTLHPIEYWKVFNEPGPENFADAQRFVDWLVKTGQNYFQWVELSTVDFDAWKPYAQSIVDYAHTRGVRVGACIQMWGGASLQNNYVLVTDAASWRPEMEAQLDRILTIGWDTLELALGEFVSAGAPERHRLVEPRRRLHPGQTPRPRAQRPEPRRQLPEPVGAVPGADSLLLPPATVRRRAARTDRSHPLLLRRVP